MNQPDVIGPIYKPTGNILVDGDGNEYPEMIEIDGFYVNFLQEVPEIAPYKLDPQPVTPFRVYAGDIAPVAYRFPSEAKFREFFPNLLT